MALVRSPVFARTLSKSLLVRVRGGAATLAAAQEAPGASGRLQRPLEQGACVLGVSKHLCIYVRFCFSY